MSDQSGIRVSRRRGFTVIYNDLLPSDGSLSARAWGVYVYLTGRPDGWETRVSHLQTVFKEGRDAIYGALRELVAAGMMAKEDYMDNGLRRTRYTLDVDAASPDTDSQEPGNPAAGSPDAGSPDPEKAGEVSTDSSSTEVASTEAANDGVAAAPPPVEQLTDQERETGRDADGALLVGKKRDLLTQEVAKAWWDWAKAQDRLPTQSFIACRQVIKTALANGHHPKRIKTALARLTSEARAISGGSLQIALGGSSGGGRGPQHPLVPDEHRESVEGLF